MRQLDLPGRDAVRTVAPRCALGESPRWASGRWWWVDAVGGELWSADPAVQEPRRELSDLGRISLVYPASDGRMVLACGGDIAIFDGKSGRVDPWVSIELEPGSLLNDGTADADGNLWVGSVHPSREVGTGKLYRVTVEREVASVVTGTQLSNGMVGTPDGALIHADSLARTITQRRQVPAGEGGELALRVEGHTLFPERPGLALPDGLALDDEGGVWVALYGAGEVVRLLGGEQVDVISIPTAQATSVALGGEDGKDLLITTAQEGLDASDLAEDCHAGALFLARAAVPASVPLKLRVPNQF